MQRSLQSFASLLILGLGAAGSIAQTPASIVDDQTVAVLSLAIDDPNQGASLLEAIAKSNKEVAIEMDNWKKQLATISDTVRAAGGHEVQVVYSLADAFEDQPLLFFPMHAS